LLTLATVYSTLDQIC